MLFFFWPLIFLFGMPAWLHAQAVSGWTGDASVAVTLPPPIRDLPQDHSIAAQPVKHPITHPGVHPTDQHTGLWVQQNTGSFEYNPLLHPHRLIVSPERQQPGGAQAARGSGAAGSGAAASTHPLARLKHHGQVQAPVPLMPQSNVTPTWKSPYSYGHFGASGTRHWSVHHGYRDRMIEWRLR